MEDTTVYLENLENIDPKLTNFVNCINYGDGHFRYDEHDDSDNQLHHYVDDAR
jgi:hypothetical protein